MASCNVVSGQAMSQPRSYLTNYWVKERVRYVDWEEGQRAQRVTGYIKGN